MDAGAEQTQGIDLRAVLARAALVVLPLVVARAGLHAAKDGYLDPELARLLARSASRVLLAGVAWTLIPALLLCWAVAALARRRAGTLAVGLALLVAAALAFAFVSFRLPASPRHVPGTGTPRELFGLGMCALVALASVLPALPSVRVPLRRALVGALPLAVIAAAVVLVWLPRERGPIGEGGDGGESGEEPNLILISLDTLRRDHLGCYGYDRETSPAIDALAARSLRFDNGFSTQPWTLTAHMSMLTGLLPSVHGLSETAALPLGIPTLADLLKPEGYLTLGVADEVAYLDPRFGYARGFDFYEQLPDQAWRKVDRILDLLDDVGGDTFFLFAHFFDAHSDWYRLPYEAAGADLEALAPWYDGDDLAWCSAEGVCASKMLLDLFERDERMGEAELERLIDLYDAGVRTLDREIGRLIDGLERRGMMEDTVILITADHGEEFFDHGKPLHGRCFDECLNVPFLLYTPPGIAPAGASPGGASADASIGRATDELASHVDIPATMLEFAGAAPPSVHQGMSLVPFIRGEAPTREREAVVIEQIDGLRGLRGKRWSLVPHGGKRLLFDLENDPGQTQELRGPELADVRRELRALLAAEEEAAEILRERFAGGAIGVELSETQEALLEDLGYAGD